MQHAILLGSTMRSADGRAGTLEGLIVNPNRNHVDYIVLRASEDDGREYFVPGSQIQRAGARELRLPCDWSELEELPHPERPDKQGTVLSNLPDLIVVRHATIVRDAAGERLGVFHGAIVDSNLEVQAMLLAEAPDRAIPIARLARQSASSGDLSVHLVRQAGAPGVAPAL